MTRPLNDFIRLFGASLSLDESLVAEEGNRYYLLNEDMKGFIKEDFLYAGTYLGETRGGRFMPSFMFLAMIAETARNKTYVDGKTAWLFICGRDIFRRGIAKMTGATGRNNCTLVMNKFDECLGFGRVIADFNEKVETVAVKNVVDIGDFLRRER
jgi:ribosome biogenesis protein Nip4